MTRAPGGPSPAAVHVDHDADIERLLRIANHTLAGTHSFLVDINSVVASASAEASDAAPELVDAVEKTSTAAIASSKVTQVSNTAGYALLAVPITGKGNQVYGALCVVSPTLAQWSGQEVAIAEDVAASAGLAFELRQTTSVLGEQLQAQQLETSVEDAFIAVASESNRAWTIESVVEALVENGRRAAGAELISILGKVDGAFRFYHGGGVPEDIAEGFVTMDVNEPYPMAFSCRTGEVVVLSDQRSFDDWPEFAETMKDSGIVALISYPIVDERGDVTAVLGLGYSSPLTSARVPPTVVRLGSLMRQGLERAAAYQQERLHASHLESMVIPQTLPMVSGIELAGRYLPPTAGQRVGGDLYDAFVMPGESAGLVVADATGHEISASQSTVQLRHALGMLSHEGRTPSEVLGGANNYLRRSRLESLITCAYAQVDPSSGELVVVNAGHPHPRILRRDGSVEVIGSDQDSQPLLGLVAVDFREIHQKLNDGDSLIMFTDGLIERRDMPLLTGEERLERELSKLGTATAEEIVEVLLALLGQERNDDVAVLVAKRVRTNDPSGNAEDLRCSWPAEELELVAARRSFRDWLLRAAPYVEPSARADMELVLTELLTNARLASGTAQSPISIGASAEATGIRIAVSNDGDPFEVDTDMPASTGERGRGLALVEALAQLDVSFRNGQTVVEALFANGSTSA